MAERMKRTLRNLKEIFNSFVQYQMILL
uniref:BLTX407 n=1 Tax=Nephila pilipes TaxID=299642 RepID=A0A076L028_NEPPI|nr:BLTX407 [Nephila pilipes]